MNRVIGMVLLCLGVVVAGLSGARNGEAYATHRARKAAQEASELPGPQERLVGWARVGGVGWGAGLGLIVVGAVLARRQDALDASGQGGRGGRLDFGVEVARALAEAEAIAALIADLPMDADHAEARDRLDRLSFEVLGPIVEARGTFVARHGLAVFAEYFGPYSAAERQLARCWSAITDGHAVVARESVAAAQQSLRAALAAWQARSGQSAV